MKKNILPITIAVTLFIICYVLVRIEEHLYHLRRTVLDIESSDSNVTRRDLYDNTETIESSLYGISKKLSDIEDAVRANR